MRRRPDQLHAALIGLMVWLGAFKAGQERMVDIDDASAEIIAHIFGQDLHVAREDDQFGIRVLDDFADFAFLFGL